MRYTATIELESTILDKDFEAKNFDDALKQVHQCVEETGGEELVEILAITKVDK